MQPAVLADYLPPWSVVVFFGIPLMMLAYVFAQDWRARRR